MIAIVAHQEHVAIRHGDFGHVVQRLVHMIDNQVARAVGQGLAVGGRLIDLRAVFQCDTVWLESGKAGIAIGADVIVFGRQANWRFNFLRNRLAIQDDLPVDQRDGVTGQGDHALDIIFRLLRRYCDNDIAIFGRTRRNTPIGAWQEVETGRNPGPAVGIFAHHKPVSHQQVWHHACAGDIERLGHEGVEGQHRQQHQAKPAHLGKPVDRLLGLVVAHGGQVRLSDALR